MGLKLITAPTTNPVSLAEAKLHLNIESADTDYDTLLDLYIKAATAYVDGPSGFLAQALVNQTWDLYLDDFPEDEIRLPLGPLLEVVSVNYTDEDGNEQTIDSSNYTTDTAQDFPWILPDADYVWPTPMDEVGNVVRIRYRAGHLDDSTSPDTGFIPDDIKAAIMLIIGDFYAHRETQVVGVNPARFPWSAEQLLRPHRKQIPLA